MLNLRSVEWNDISQRAVNQYLSQVVFKWQVEVKPWNQERLSMCQYCTHILSIIIFCQNWLAFDSLHRPLFSEHSEVTFQNDVLPSESDNFAFCKVSTRLNTELVLVAKPQEFLSPKFGLPIDLKNYVENQFRMATVLEVPFLKVNNVSQ